MNATRTEATAKDKKQRAPVRRRTANRTLAERSSAVAPVGAWVENGEEFVENPCALALITERLQAERRKANEERLQRFQDEVRHRVAQRYQIIKKRRQPHIDSQVESGRRTPLQRGLWTQYAPPVERVVSEGDAAQRRGMEQGSEESSEGIRQVRLRLASCRHGETASELPGGNWSTSPARHEVEHHGVTSEQGEEDAHTKEGDTVFTRHHKCHLVQQKHRGHVTWDTDKPEPEPVLKVLWPQTDQEELKRQRLSQFLMQRRQLMHSERERVKDNIEHRKHLKRNASIKAEKEHIRLEEEKKLEGARRLAEAKQRLQQRELLILERLKLEEEERALELLTRKREEKHKESTRFIGALRARVKEKLSQEKAELPPLCCCASSFWDSHPDTCANNCVFYNNPKAYAQALHSAMLSLDHR